MVQRRTQCARTGVCDLGHSGRVLTCIRPLVGACQVIRNHRDTSNPHYGPRPFCSLADTKRVILIRGKLKLVQEMTGTCPEVSQYSIWNEVPPSSRHGLQQGIYT